ncbi:hypothetical protein [Acidimangrovimonas sediminis]|uniref:hypothetical protein n=1 Tax=Acidimangrovimonas sediminis TaxID=2056283 RepID=UPI000C803C2F|nr:hypothetical protein [Acidimangrovimonas sediminis]
MDTPETDQVTVTLSGPAKVDGKVKPAGATVTVTGTLLAHLKQAGVVKAVTELGEEVKGFVEKTIENLREELEAAVARAEKAEGALADLSQAHDEVTTQVADLQAQLAAATTTPTTETPTATDPAQGKAPAASNEAPAKTAAKPAAKTAKASGGSTKKS